MITTSKVRIALLKEQNKYLTHELILSYRLIQRLRAKLKKHKRHNMPPPSKAKKKANLLTHQLN